MQPTPDQRAAKSPRPDALAGWPVVVRSGLRVAWLCGLFACLAGCDGLFQSSPQQGTLVTATVAPAEPPDLSTLRLQPSELSPGIKRLRFGVSPFASVAEQRAQFGPLCDWLTQTLGVPVVLQKAASYQTLVQQLVDGEIDFALLSPLSYVHARDREPRLELVARTLGFGAPEYSAFLLVRADDPAQSLADLQNRRIAWVDPLSAAGYLFPYASLLEQGLVPEQLFAEQQFLGTHMAALTALLRGKADVAAVSSGTLALLRDQGALESFAGGVRILAKAGRIPYDAVVVGPRLGRAAARKIGAAFMALSTRSSDGRQILLRTWGLSGWMPADDSSYDSVRATLIAVERAQGKPVSLPVTASLEALLDLPPPATASEAP